MKTAKLVTGIICMALTILVLLQSCAAGVSNVLSDNGEVSGSAGAILAILMLAGGIVEVASRNSLKKGGSIAALVLFLIACLFGYTNAGTYTDLYIWSTWCLLLGLFNLVSLFIGKKGGKAPKAERNSEQQ